MCFNVLHMQSPEVTAEVGGHWSLANNFACSFQIKRAKRLHSPQYSLQGTFPPQIRDTCLKTAFCVCVLYISGTVKVKSSGIQVGDLIIVEKVCYRLFHPHLWIVLLFKDFHITIYMAANNEGGCQSSALRWRLRPKVLVKILWSCDQCWASACQTQYI